MDISYKIDQLVAIEYPGQVINVQKMLRTFGGEKEINSIFNDSSKRLGLKFRPDDPYCKYSYGDRYNTTNLVLKVVKRTRKSKKNVNKTLQEATSYNVEFLGLACTTFKFKAMVDFQILPLVNENSTFKSLIPELVPNEIHSASWLDLKVPLFIPPLVYSRFDFPQGGYIDAVAKVPRKPVHNPLPPNVIGRSRKKRTNFAVFTTFESTDTCCQPNPQALNELNAHASDMEVKVKIERAFEERPIWTRNSLITRLQVDRIRLKNLLTCFAYHFTNGPWRTLWVRFGYNPRKEPSAKMYQVLDYRINASVLVKGDKNYKKKCTANYPHRSKISQNSQQRIAMINTDDLIPSIKDDSNDSHKKSSLNEYFPGVLPSCRQCFYQLCDIHLDEVQQLIHKNDGYEQSCHEKEGWLEQGTYDKIRELITADVLKTINLKEAEN